MALLSTIPIEAYTLCFSLLGALVIARLTVNWALARFQSEKTWERRMAAYLDALSAIGAMENLVGGWLERAYMHRSRNDELREEEDKKYREASRSLVEGTLAARLLFPDKTVQLLNQLDEELRASRNTDGWVEHLEEEALALRKAKEALIRDGREVLELK